MKKPMKNLCRLLFIFYTGLALANPNAGGESLYQLQVDLTDHTGTHVGLDTYRGQPVIIGMFYASCPYVCPLTINTLQRLEAELDPEHKKQLRVLLVSLDAERDTAEHLSKAVKQHNVDTSRWKLLRTDAASVRTLAAVLGIRFRKLPNGEFNHTTLLTLLDAQGTPAISSSQLAQIDPALLEQIKELLSSP